MNLYVEIDGRRALRGSYPDNNNPNIARAAEINAKSWFDAGYRVWFDDREVTMPTPETMATTRETFEVVTTPRRPVPYGRTEKIAA